MKLLINNKEIAHFLLHLLDPIRELEKLGLMKINYPYTDEFVKKLNPKMLELRNRDKLKDKIIRNVKDDLSLYKLNAERIIEEFKVTRYEKVHGKIEYFIEQLGLENIFERYLESDFQHFVKSTGLNIDPSATLIRRKDFSEYKADCLIRNTVGNEELLVTKVDMGYPMWFIDSGYTNFLEPNKKWHRLVRNHLHYGDFFEAPVDRLGNFKTFPRQWRESGDKILIMEPGPFAAQVFHADLKTWKYDIEKELRKHTDKPIVFREKAPKKEREPFFKHLLDEDYYCIVSLNSNAATEAIWAGVPAITMGKHISNPVTVSKLSDVNNLYRGDLSRWLCMLSYSQFTKDELMNGTAQRLVNEYQLS